LCAFTRERTAMRGGRERARARERESEEEEEEEEVLLTAHNK